MYLALKHNRVTAGPSRHFSPKDEFAPQSMVECGARANIGTKLWGSRFEAEVFE
jgi:hypothetical protein